MAFVRTSPITGRLRPMNVDVLLPFVRESRSARVVVLPGLLILCVLHLMTAVRPTLLVDGLNATAAWIVTGAAVALALGALAALVAQAVATDCTRAVPLGSRLFRHGLALAAALSLYGVSSSTLGLPRGVAFVLACIAAVAILVAHGRHVLRVRATPAHRSNVLAHPQRAEELIAECREALLDPSLTTERRSALDLLMAAALADLAILADRYEHLAEAEEILARSMATAPAAGLAGAAVSFAPALVAKARWNEDLTGLENGLELVARTMSSVPTMLPWVARLLLFIHSQGLLLLRERAETEGDAARAELLHASAVEDLERALSLTRRGTLARANLRFEMAAMSWVSSRRGGLDAAIEHSRAALRSLRFRRVRVREKGYLVLADLLAERAERDSELRGPDVAEALTLCERVAAKGLLSHRAMARLPILLDMSGADECVTARAFRRAFPALSADSFDDACALAAEWALWAERRCYTTEAAEAHLCWIRTVFAESQRLRLRGERQRPRCEIQALAADAGFWLLAAGRRRDAALVLDLASGAGLTERLHRDRGEVEERLTAAGREDLRDRWLEVGERVAEQRPTASDVLRDRSGISTVRIGGQTFRGRFSPHSGVPLADYERLVREISRVPGFEDVDPPPTYEDLREAAHGGPLVYLAAAEHGGFAVVVTEDAEEPAVVALPGLTSVDTEARVRVLLEPEWSDVADSSLELTLMWLRRYVIKPLEAVLAPPALVTLVPVGAFGLLPVHAAGMERMADGCWRDRTGGLVFRYAPSARLLARARLLAQDSATLGGSVVTVAASGSVAHVLSALDDAAIWHVACPAEHDPYDPLASSLQLADGRLSLRAVLAPERPAPRLAVLSACRTAIGPDMDVNEIFSLASALLQAGAAGVVSSQTAFDGPGGSLLVLGFLQRFLDGEEPALALAGARDWLSAAMNRELAETFGPLYELPDYLPASERRVWERRRAFADPRHWAAFSYCGA